MKRFGAFVAAALALGFAPALLADLAPGPGPRRSNAARIEREVQRLRDQAAARASAAPSASGAAPPSAAPSASASALPSGARAEELARQWAALAATRLERRDRHRAALVREIGARLSDPEVKAELKLHATRLAELSRVEFLATHARSGEAREKLLARVSKLGLREGERHRKRLAQLTAAPPAASASAAPVAPKPAPNTGTQP